MTPENNIKEKVLASLTVVFLFSLVGVLFFYISLDNKRKTEVLRAIVREQKVKEENKLALEKIHLREVTDLDSLNYASVLPLPKITSKSFLTLAITDTGVQKVLNEKNSTLVLPIASITKLMVAIITLENINPETKVTATLDYIGKEESAFVIETDKIYKVYDLLANALISSDNDSARLLSSTLGETNFLAKMNLKAQELGLTQTNFANVTGLDPQTPAHGINVSTVTDLANLVIYIKEKYPEILDITANNQYNFCDINNFCKVVVSTNKFLEDKSFKYKIIGGKTGSTDLALKNLVLVTKPTDNLTLINIVLGSVDNFMDTSSLINQIEINN